MNAQVNWKVFPPVVLLAAIAGLLPRSYQPWAAGLGVDGTHESVLEPVVAVQTMDADCWDTVSSMTLAVQRQLTWEVDCWDAVPSTIPAVQPQSIADQAGPLEDCLKSVWPAQACVVDDFAEASFLHHLRCYLVLAAHKSRIN